MALITTFRTEASDQNSKCSEAYKDLTLRFQISRDAATAEVEKLLAAEAQLIKQIAQQNQDQQKKIQAHDECRSLKNLIYFQSCKPLESEMNQNTKDSSQSLKDLKRTQDNKPSALELARFLDLTTYSILRAHNGDNCEKDMPAVNGLLSGLETEIRDGLQLIEARLIKLKDAPKTDARYDEEDELFRKKTLLIKKAAAIKSILTQGQPSPALRSQPTRPVIRPAKKTAR